MRNSAEYRDAIKRQLTGEALGAEFDEGGRVTRVGDGIVHIDGLRAAMSGELLAFPDDVVGMVLNLERHDVGAVLFGAADGIREGDTVRRTGRLAQVPVGPALLGRVVDALGRPIDGKGPIATRESRAIERYAPGVVDRRAVTEGEDVFCVYVAIGQKQSTVARVVKVLEDAGAMAYTTVVLAGASDSAPLQYIAPYTGVTMAE